MARRTVLLCVAFTLYSKSFRRRSAGYFRHPCCGSWWSIAPGSLRQFLQDRNEESFPLAQAVQEWVHTLSAVINSRTACRHILDGSMKIVSFMSNSSHDLKCRVTNSFSAVVSSGWCGLSGVNILLFYLQLEVHTTTTTNCFYFYVGRVGTKNKNKLYIVGTRRLT